MLNFTTKVINWFTGKKTIIGIIAGFSYGIAIHYGLTSSNDVVWGAIATWTGVSFKIGLNRLNTTTTDVIPTTVPNAVKYIPTPAPEPPEALAG